MSLKAREDDATPGNGVIFADPLQTPGCGEKHNAAQTPVIQRFPIFLFPCASLGKQKKFRGFRNVPLP